MFLNVHDDRPPFAPQGRPDTQASAGLSKTPLGEQDHPSNPLLTHHAPLKRFLYHIFKHLEVCIVV